MILIYNQQGKILQTIEISNPSVERNYDASPNFKLSVDRRYKSDEYMVSNGSVVQLPSKPNPYAEFDFAQGQWITNADIVSSMVRIKRDQELSDTDWTQGKDVPDNISQTWATYRQALRDITQQPGFPINVVWPVRPA